MVATYGVSVLSNSTNMQKTCEMTKAALQLHVIPGWGSHSIVVHVCKKLAQAGNAQQLYLHQIQPFQAV